MTNDSRTECVMSIGPLSTETGVPRQTTVVLRSRPEGNIPPAGSYIAGKSGKSVYLVCEVVRLRTPEDKAGKCRARLICARVRRSDLPDGAEVRPWPDAPQDPGKRLGKQGPEPRTPADRSAIRKTRSDQRRALRERVESWDDGDPLVPSVQSCAVMAADGSVLRGPHVRNGSWRDPEDTNRASRVPKLVHGSRRTDPLETLAKRSSAIEPHHIQAADCYRLAYELGDRGKLKGWHLGEPRGQGFGPSMGPSDRLAINAMKLADVIAYVGDRRAIDALDHIVLQRNDVTSWANRVKMDRKKAVKFLLGVLDHLVLYFKEEIEKRMRLDKLEMVS